MNRSHAIMAFAVGFAVTLVGGTVMKVRAQSADQGSLYTCVAADGTLRMAPPSATCAAGERTLTLRKATPTAGSDNPKPKEQPQDPSIDEAILNDLNRRLFKLENMECAALGKNRVTAPFQVFDRSGKKVLYVDGSGVRLFNNSGRDVIRMLADAGGGLFVADGFHTRVFFGISDPQLAGVGVSENDQRRVALGRDLASGVYSLKFLSNSGQQIAAVGVPRNMKSGLVQVNMSGMLKAGMGVSDDGRGSVDILGDRLLAQLTESAEHHGGKLWIGNAAGTGMVEAGDAGGYGIVKAGPNGFEFIPTPGLALPGSVIVGRRQ